MSAGVLSALATIEARARERRVLAGRVVMVDVVVQVMARHRRRTVEDDRLATVVAEHHGARDQVRDAGQLVRHHDDGRPLLVQVREDCSGNSSGH